jgi:hypothetical protein
VTRALPLLAPLGAAIFSLAWLILGFISPGYRLFDLVIEPYSPIAQPISGLGLGVTAPYMNTAFVLGGVLVAAGSLASIGRLAASRPATAAHVLIATTGLGMIVDGVFTLESVLLHLAGFLLAVPIPAVGFVLLAATLRRTRPRLSVALVVGAVLAIALFVLFQVTFDPYSAGDNSGYSGLVQRALVTVVLAAVSIVAVTAASRPTPGGTAR